MTRSEASKKDSEFGYKDQDAIMQVFLKAGRGIKRADQDGWRDFILDAKGETFKIEIKTERYIHSGNICIETFQGNTRRPSGLSLTGADIWIHKLGSSCALYQVPEMKMWLDSDASIYKIKSSLFNKADGGCGGYIIPIRYLSDLKWFDFVDTYHLPRSKVFIRPEISIEKRSDNYYKEKKQLELFE